PNLLFAGTEFGAFFSPDGGNRWIEFKGLPTIAVRDLAIQRRENDLVFGTFGRGFWVLDDYSNLRGLKAETLQQPATLFPVKPTRMFVEREPLGLRGKGFLGETLYTAANPPAGAVFTYHLKEDLKTRQKARWEAEAQIEGEGGNVSYPSWDELRAEDRESDPVILLTITDQEGNVVRRLTGPTTAGFHRVSWDLRFPAFVPPSEGGSGEDLFDEPDRGPMAAPGTYRVSLAQRVGGKLTPLGEPQTFQATPLGLSSLPATDMPAVNTFQQKTGRLQRAIVGALELVDETSARLDAIQKALVVTPRADDRLSDEADALERRLQDIDVALSGDTTLARRNEGTPPSIFGRINNVVEGQWNTTMAPTQTHQDAYRLAAEAFTPVLAELTRLVETDLKALEDKMEAAGAPWTPGRVPTWQPE
ncbi:MAG TPA: glycosyl hydrolase, partial [Thermoanaerobaculia bacterium]|nr:glycosyl hydrolase [Thermoanaerobaculia bacterium]